MPKARHPVVLSAAAFILLLVCANYGTAVLFLVGLPGFLILVGIAGGARMPSRIPARDTIVYVFISLGVVAVAILLAVYAVHTNRDIFDLNSRWTTIAFAAMFAFGFIIKDFRIHRRRPGFWLLFAGLLAAHFAILPYVFPAGKQIPFLLAAPLLSIGEMFAMYILFGLSGFPPKRSQPHNGA
jgi:peptidoglycan/LPS O-acetylase OafA/YrhL